jgi:murein DD-endopeptidase MepM/ murein hydrolase activator NlpD
VGAGAAANPIAPSGSIDSVLGLLSAPPNVGVERPALQHFQPTAAITARLAALAAGAPGSDNPAGGPRLPVLVVLSALMGSAVVAMVLVVFVRRVVPARFRRAAEVAAGPFGAVALISVLLLVPKSAAITTAQPATPPRVAALVVSTHRVSPAVQAAPTAGTVLLGRITSIEQTVTNLESRLQVYNTRAAQTAQGDSAMAPPEVLGSGAIAQTTQTDTATQLAGALQAEYAFYATTVKNDAADHALLSATAAVADPVRTVIAYNLEAVQTQLAQEAAIAQADAAAPTLAGLAPTALLAPLSGPITQPFGPSSLAFEPPLTVGGVTYPHFHTGIDIAAPRDTPVHAAAGGLVVIAGSSLDSQGHLAGYGNYIVLAHAGKMMTLYAHLDQLLASVGEVVHAGDVIGLEGSSGNSTGPHLHFEVRIGGLVTDPLPYLTQKF